MSDQCDFRACDRDDDTPITVHDEYGHDYCDTACQHMADDEYAADVTEVRDRLGLEDGLDVRDTWRPDFPHGGAL